MISIVEEICCTSVVIVIGRDSVNLLKDEAKGKVLIVRQQSVPYDKVAGILGGNAFELVLEGGEQDKDIDVVFKIIDTLYSNGFQRKDSIVAVGGGTLIDVVGFAASIYMRGVKLIAVPTTLLGMVDAAIGGKNAVNFKGVKNVLGTIYQPSKVVVDLGFLETLPQHEFVNGLTEVIKYGIVLDKDLFGYLKDNASKVLNRDAEALEHVVYRSILNKLSIVKEDPYELKDIRIVLNFGHTIGHVIEATSRFQVPHGRAVAVGMVLETALGISMGITPEYCLDQVLGVLKSYGLPTHPSDLGTEIDRNAIKLALLKDKKARGDSIVMPLPSGIGSWRRCRVPIELLEEAIFKWIG